MWAVLIDIAGKKFGKWTVLERAGKSNSGNVSWLCKCDCGEIRVVAGEDLRNGNSKSCGCAKASNIAGQRFGRLVAVEPVGKHRSRAILWRCACDCGNEIIAQSINLISGNTTSCGCKRDERIRKLNIENNPAMKGEKSHLWRGGVSFEPYCPKFNNDLKRRIRAFFEYRCVACGKTTEENGKKLCCHHVEYNKSACCDGKPVHFAALCGKHHSMTNRDRDRWEAMLHRIIDEIYDGKSYFMKDEM